MAAGVMSGTSLDGVDAVMIGPTSADPALQVRAIEDLIAQRTAAKVAKNYAEADRIRKLLLAQGIELKDSPTGTAWMAAP